jgi:hypothetical protein
MAESSAGDFTVGKIQKTRRQRVAKMYGQQKRNIIHTSSTAYEQDHSAAAHNPRARPPCGWRLGLRSCELEAHQQQPTARAGAKVEPRRRRAAEQRDELAAFHRCNHSITSLARTVAALT